MQSAAFIYTTNDYDHIYMVTIWFHSRVGDLGNVVIVLWDIFHLLNGIEKYFAQLQCLPKNVKLMTAALLA